MTRTAQYSLFAAALSLCLAPACVGDDALDRRQFEPKTGCSEPQCGSNSPSLGDYSLAEVHQAAPSSVKGAQLMNKLSNLANQDGLYLINFFDPSGNPVKYTIRSDGELVIADPTGLVLSGSQVVGSVFQIGHKDPGEPDQFLTILEYHYSVAYWLGPNEYIHSYEMTYNDDLLDPPSSGTPLCPGPYTEPTSSHDAHRDVVFSTGERYNFTTRKIFDHGVDSQGWANIACFRDGPSKSYLLRRRPETPDGEPYYTTVDERQALLHMFAADYCGDGSSFTYQGHPLEYEDTSGFITTQSLTATSEAIWAPNGAVCLDTPRLDTTYTKAAIEAKCEKVFPDCSDVQFNSWQNTHYFRSFTP